MNTPKKVMPWKLTNLIEELLWVLQILSNSTIRTYQLKTQRIQLLTPPLKIGDEY